MTSNRILPPELGELKKFHGHLGPYAVVGYRMGKLACSLLSARGKKLRALVKTGLTPPLSCIIDGVQLSSCCTMGKGNISATDDGIPFAIFDGEKTVGIRLRDRIEKEISENTEEEEIAALRVWQMSDDELFLVKLQ